MLLYIYTNTYIYIFIYLYICTYTFYITNPLETSFPSSYPPGAPEVSGWARRKRHRGHRFKEAAEDEAVHDGSRGRSVKK